MSLSVKRVFAQRWADMSDDDSLGELPSTAAIKAQLVASSEPTATSQPLLAPPAVTQPSSDIDTTSTPPVHEKPTMPPPAPIKPTVTSHTTASPSPAAPTIAVPTTAPIVFQSKPKPGFKSWTDLARPASTAFSTPATPVPTITVSPFATEAADPVRRVLSFGESDDDNSRMDALPLPVTATAAGYDPELDNSRDGLPLLLRQSTMVGGLGRLAEDDNDGMDASMETSRDRGIKRKQAESEAPTPRNTPVKEQAAPSKQLVTAWAAGQVSALFGKTRSATVAIQTDEPVVTAVPSKGEVKDEATTKKQKVSESQAAPTKAATPRAATTTCPAPLPASIIRPLSVVNGRVTRSAWKRVNDAAAPVPPPSPTLSAINSVAPAERKQRMVVKKRDLSAAPTISTLPSPTVLSITPPASATASPDSPTPSTASTTPAPPPSPRTLARRLEQRQKQIVLGKRTVGYQRYRGAVHKRERVDGQHPRTPNAKRACSKRSWDGQVRKWRRELHRWDEGRNGEKLEGELDDSVDGEADGEGEVEEGEVASELGSEWSMRDEGEAVSELGSELNSELSSKRGDETEATEMNHSLEDGLVAVV